MPSTACKRFGNREVSLAVTVIVTELAQGIIKQKVASSKETLEEDGSRTFKQTMGQIHEDSNNTESTSSIDVPGVIEDVLCF